MTDFLYDLVHSYGFVLGLKVVACLLVFLTVPLVVGQMEHKAMAHMQARLGPMYAGAFHGWAQLVADGVKFVQKEDVVPTNADPWVFKLAPAVSLLPPLFVLVVIPWSPGIVAERLDIGLFYALAVTSVGVIGMLMAAWSSANKFSLLGGIRGAAQLIAYELPLVLAAASVAMMASTLSLTGIVQAWHWWWVPAQAIALFLFFSAGLAELNRPPFDMPVADSEIIFGHMTEYTGLRFAFFLLAEYAGIVVLGALIAVLFLGGWRGPVLPPMLWT
ncbi:MAG: NADH-quinone oxidoreductase subunit H, partial [Mycobacteriales bacterium]